MEVVRCASCDGYGWEEGDSDEALDCVWCRGVGYVYRDVQGIDQHIPEEDYEIVADRLEQLELERLREMGYQGEAKKPWEQKVRQERGILLNHRDLEK